MVDVIRKRHAPFRARRFFSIRFVGVSALVAAAVLLVGIAVVLLLGLGALGANVQLVEHTDTVLVEVSNLQLAMAMSESGIRGFALNGTGAARRELEDGVADTKRHLQALRTLVSDNSEQTRRLRALAPLLRARGQLLAYLVRLPPEAIRAIAMSTKPEDIQRRAKRTRMRAEVSRRLADFRNVEASLLAQRQETARQAGRRTAWLLIASVLLAPFCAGGGLFLLQRERSRNRLRAMQSELNHVHRLNTMGATAAALAHEINQPLTAASNFVAALRRTIPEAQSAKLDALAERINQQLVRIGDIVQRLRNFVEKRDDQREPVAPQAIVDDAVSLLGTFRHAVLFTCRVAPGLPELFVDRVQIQQVLVNLMRNALEAMEGGLRPELALSVEGQEDGVVFRLTDTGPGLPEMVVQNLFVPFTTTKPAGMGVGLSICRAIIADHGGEMGFEAAPGGGTTFHFSLPARAA